MSFKRSSTVEPYSKRQRRAPGSSRDSDCVGKWSRNPKFELAKVPKQSDPNYILRVTVLNPGYEVTTETLNYLFSQYGNVLRIVLFSKTGLQNAMIEFDSVEGASRARDYLNGFDMYWGGANKLQIEFAWTTKLFVVVNDPQKSWDYTKICDSYYQPIVPQSYYDSCYQFTPTEPIYHNVSPKFYNEAVPNMTHVITQQQPQQLKTYQSQKTLQPTIMISPVPVFQPNVMYISGLNYETSNTEKLFNLLSLYGNVAKIQFLPSRQGTAIVQMFDSLSVDYCVRYLNNIPIGSKGMLQVYWANPNYMPNNCRPFALSDGSGSYKDFTDSKNQRFLVPRPSFWIQAPSKIVRYYNTPSSLTEENLMDIFHIKPKQVRSLRMPADDESHVSRGLIEFASIAQAILAIMRYNNKDIKSKTKTVHYMKLCFSSSQSLDLKN